MELNQFIKKYNIVLNEQQLDAVRSVDGPVLLLAVPGSGKTTVLVVRLGYMIFCCGIEPESILTVTYTVAAAADMRSRFNSIFGAELGRRLEFRTINGLCAKIIQSYEYASRGSAFSLISDEKEISGLLSSIYHEVSGTFPTESDIKTVRTLITYAKNMMLTDDELSPLDKECPYFTRMYRRYCDILRERRMMDYDDQMVYAYRILERYPSILEQYQRRFRYICVDEAQDTSKIQHKVISLLSKGQTNLFMVGDEDQSIYGFRAAYPDALMSFEQDHPGAKVLLMEENFRSDASIVTAADRFIGRNTQRHPKKMRTSRPSSAAITEEALNTRRSQYDIILKKAQSSETIIAVLYRDNESALPLIDRLERSSLPYRIRAADLTFFSHRIVQDIRNIISFAYDPYDTEIFIQIYYKLSTYLNKASAQIACDISRRDGVSVWDAIFSLESISAGAAKGCRMVKAQLERMKLDRADIAIERIFRHMGYCDYLDRMGLGQSKIDILASIGENEHDAQSLVRRLYELEQIMRNSSNNSGNLILSTIHSSKGLEYDTVYLIDVYDGMFPEVIVSNPKTADKETLRTYEEERRLFYVGTTRAKNALRLFTYKDHPSAFCREFLGRDSFAAPAGQTVAVTGTSIASTATPSSPAYDEFCKRCRTGHQLVHRIFGRGTVLTSDGDIITVYFASGQTKKLSISALFSQNLLRE